MVEIENAIHAAMVAAGFDRDRRCTAGLRFTGVLLAAGHEVRVSVLFEHGSLSRLPKLALLHRDADMPNSLAHVELEDRVCYAQEIDLLLDPHRPDASVRRCLDAMKSALDSMARGLDHADIAREFPQHWLGDLVIFLSQEWPKSQDAFLFSINRKLGALNVLASNEDELRRFGLNKAEIAEAKGKAHRVQILRTATPLTFRPGLRQPRNLAEFLEWGASVATGLDERLAAALSRQPPDNLVTFVSAPNGVVGIRAKIPDVLRRSMQRPDFLQYLIGHHAREIPVVRFSGDRADPAFVFSRNVGAQPNLSGKTIALVGIGTIGSTLAKLLVQSAAGLAGGKLLLVDNQILRPGNVGRHYLSLPSVGEYKAAGCTETLERQFADCNIFALSEDVLDHLHELDGYDLVIDATGDEALSAEMNLYFENAEEAGRKCPARLHVWLEGNGVAARALLVDGPTCACFRCLNDVEGRPRYRILREDHPATVTAANCGEGAYFAYGPGAPAIAAGLATQMALDWAAGRPSPRHRAIRIVSDATHVVKDQDPPKLKGCPACAEI